MVAYLIKTTVESHLGGPQNVPDKLNISAKVWSAFSRIISTEDPEYGRKADGRPGPLPRTRCTGSSTPHRQSSAGSWSTTPVLTSPLS